MKEKNLQNNLLTALGNHKALIMDLGDDVLLHMKWQEDTITPDWVKGCYVDETGMTSMELILEIINDGVYINGHKVEIREDLWHLKIYKRQTKA